MRVSKMYDWWTGGSQAPSDGFTNSDGQQAFVIIGDSLFSGAANNTGIGPTTLAGTCYEWDNTNSELDELTTQDLSTSTVNNGTPFKKFALDYNAATGKKPVFVACGASGSEFSPNGDNNNWSTTGTLYAAMKTKTDNCLAFLGVERPRKIWVCAGINDSRGAVAVGTITADITSLFDRLTTDYPDTEIGIVITGRKEANVTDTRTGPIRAQLRTEAVNRTNVQVVANLASYFTWALYGADNLHLTQTGNNFLGEQLARFEATDSSFNKWARGVIACLYSDVTSGRKTLINTVITNLGLNWNKVPSFFFAKAADKNSFMTDWGMMAESYDGGFTFTANDCITTNGTSTYFQTGYPPANIPFGGLSQNNIAYTVKNKQVISNDGVTRRLFGTTNGTVAIQLSQTVGTNINYTCQGNASKAYVTETTFEDGASYTLGRDGASTPRLLKNGVLVDSGTNSSNGFTTRVMTYGCNDGNGVNASFINADYHVMAVHSYTDFDHVLFNTEISRLVNNW